MVSAPVLDDRLRQALVDSRQRYKDLVEICSDFVWETDAEGRFVFVSPRGALGYGPGDLLGRLAESFLADGGPAPAASPFRARREVADAEVWFRAADGADARLRVAARPLLDADGRRRGARGACRDITVELARESALARANTRERLLAHITQVMRDTPDPRQTLDLTIQAAGRALSATGGDILRLDDDGPVLAARFGPAPPPPLVAASGADGPAVSEVGAYSVFRAASRFQGAVTGYLCLWRPRAHPWTSAESDLAAAVADRLGIAHAQIRQHAALERASMTDPLTGLMNRRAFADGLAIRLAHARRTGRSGALAYVDLDNFKLVNDRQGHDAGDAVLCEVAGLLTAGNRAADLAARLGGDEFALWLEETAADGARTKAQALLADGRRLADRSGEPGRPFGFSIGIAVFDPADDESQEALLARADAAMYAAKSAGRGSFVLADPAASAREAPRA